MEKSLPTPRIIALFTAALKRSMATDATVDWAMRVVKTFDRQVNDIAEELSPAELVDVLQGFRTALAVCLWRAGAEAGIAYAQGQVTDPNDCLPQGIFDAEEPAPKLMVPAPAREEGVDAGIELGEELDVCLASFSAWAQRHALLFGD